MAGHARLSASQTKRWATCPGSAAYLEAHPSLDGGSGYHAQMGTCAHALVERCLSEGSEPSDYLGRLIEIVEDRDGNEGTSILKKGAKWPKDSTRVIFEVDADMAEAVECMTGYVRGRCVELGLVDEGFNDEERAREVVNLVAKGTVRLEGKVVPLPDRDDTGGTGDVIIDAWPDLLEVVDYKHGSGVFVPVEGNEQLRSYGLGALREAGADDYERVRYTICQPRHQQAPEDGIMSEDTEPSELLAWADWLSVRAEKVDEARRAMMQEGMSLDGLYEAGLLSYGEDGAHCTFCPLISGCPAALAKAQEMACADFDDEPHELEANEGPNRLAVLLPWVPFIDKWLRAIEADAERHMLQGGAIEGQKVVRGRSYRKWVTERRIKKEDSDEVEVLEVTEADIAISLKDDFGLTDEQIYTEPKLITGPQAEKLVPKAERQRFNDKLLHKPEGKLTIAPETDKREAVTIDPAADFDGVED